MSSLAAGWLTLLFGFALYLNAALLTVMQPMVGRTLLPQLGGNALAWNACLVFFQSAWLFACVYAVLTHRTKFLRWRPWLHLLIVFFAILLAYVGLIGDARLGDVAYRLNTLDRFPVISTFAMLIATIGVPFLVVAATGPLLVRWFAHLDHPRASDPYFLFAASNLGGLSALVVHPLLIDPNVPLYAQWSAWRMAWIGVAILLLVVAIVLWLSPRNVEMEPADHTTPMIGERGSATWPRQIYWLFASAVPAAVMMAASDYLTLDVAPAPVLWAVPFALYLLAFSQAFGRLAPFESTNPVVFRTLHIGLALIWIAVLGVLCIAIVGQSPWGSPEMPALTTLCALAFVAALLTPSRWLTVVQPLAAVAAVFVQTNIFRFPGLRSPNILFNVVLCYWTMRLCLDMLARDRPAIESLNRYYVWVALGGLLGGAFQLFVVPFSFRWGYIEFAFLLSIGSMLRLPWRSSGLLDDVVGKIMLPRSQPEASEAPPSKRWITLACDLGLPVVVAGIAVGLFFIRFAIRPETIGFGRGALPLFGGLLMDIPLLISLLLALVLIARPLRFGLALAGIILFSWIGRFGKTDDSLVAQGRNLFGLHKVIDRQRTEGTLKYTERQLQQGSVSQGSAIVSPARLERYPTTYYHRGGPAGRIMQRLHWFTRVNANIKRNRGAEFWTKEHPDNTADDARIAASLVGANAAFSAGLAFPAAAFASAWSEPPYALVGLGAGTLFAYAHPFQHVDAFELNPAIIAMSEASPPTFPFFQKAKERGVIASIVPGDGRRSLARSGRERFYHAIFVDVFNSDSIPPHMATMDAIEDYFNSLAPEGVVCVHVSNRHVEIEKVFHENAKKLGIAFEFVRAIPENDVQIPGISASSWVLLTRNSNVMKKWLEAGQLEQFELPNRLGGIQSGREHEWSDEQFRPMSVLRRDERWAGLIVAMLVLMLVYSMFLGFAELIAAFMASDKGKDSSERGASAP